jgi:hypothetical protein
VIYLCIPAHNEEQTVGVVLWKLRQVMAELQRDYQLLVADDASTDRTPDVLEPYTRVLPLTVLRNERRRGYAASLEMLLREAVNRSDYPKRDIVVALQADFTDEPGHVATLIKRMESGADIVATNMLPLRNLPRLVRWRRPVLNGLLRRLGWPDEVRDPLNGFSAYRVLCIRRAIEERKGDRLLRWEGWVANAELLREAAPHARRVDAIELQPHAERLQRASRFLFMPMLRQVLGLRRGRAPAGLEPVESLRPAKVVGGPSSQRSLVAESLRDSASRGTDERAQRHGASRGARNGAPRRESKQTRPGAERQRQPVAEGARRERPPRKKRPEPVAEATAPNANGAAPAAVTGKEPTDTSPRKRSRRGRRGGRSRTGQQTSSGAESQDSAVSGEAIEDSSVEGGEVDAELQATTGDTDVPRRRRPRRGGRGRRRRPGDDAQQTGPEIPEASSPPAPEPPIEDTTTPRAS